jgi:hypothetical protein
MCQHVELTFGQPKINLLQQSGELAPAHFRFAAKADICVA